MEFIAISNVGASTYPFMKVESSEYYQALSTFIQRYDPSDVNSTTDFFSSKEIQTIVKNHTGVEIELGELHNLLVQMHYTYQLEEDEFRWMVKKV